MKRKPIALMIAVTLAGVLVTAPLAANEAYDKAQQYIAEKDYNSAIIELKNAVQQEPKNAQARLVLGKTYIRVNRWSAAEKELLKAAELGADKLEWMQSLAQVLSAQGRVNEIKRYVKLDTSEPAKVQSETLAILGMVEMVQTDMARAKSNFDDALKLDENNQAALLGLTNVAIRQQEYNAGISYVDRVLIQDKSNPEGLLLKSQLLGLTEKVDEAFTLLQQAIDNNPSFIQARMLRTNFNLSLRNFADAKVDIDYLQQLLPKNFMVELLQGKSSLMQGDYEQATELLSSAQSRINVAHPELEKLLGLLDINAKNWEQAELHLTTSLQLNKGDSAVALLLANLYSTQLQQPLKAIPIYEDLLRQSPAAQDIIIRLSDAYNRSGDVDKATELLERSMGDATDTIQLETMLAQIKLTSGEMAEAITMLENTSKSGEASLQNAWLIMSYIRQGSFAKAESVISSVLTKEPDNALFNNMLGVSYLAQKKFAESVNLFEKAVKKSPQYLAAHFNLVRAYRAQRKDSDALNKLLSLDKSFADNAKIAYTLYQAYLSAGNRAEAESWLKKSVNRDGAFDPAVTNLIATHLNNNNKIEALAIANQFVTQEPSNPEAHFQLGRIYLSEQDNSRISQAIESFQTAVNIAPKSSRFTLALGRALMTDKDTEGALKAMDRFLLGTPEDAAITSAKVRLQLEKRNFAGASSTIRGFDKASENQPLVDELNGDVAVAQEKNEEAIKLYQQAYKARASSRLALKLHQGYSRTNDTKNAEQVLLDWLEQTPKDAFVHFGLANWYQQQNQVDKAISQYEKTIEHNPNYLFALNNLAWIYMERKQPRALDLAKRVESLRPNRADVLDTVGWIYVQFEQAEKGLPLLERALELNPELREARYHAAVAHHKLGNNQQAKSLIGDLVQSGKPFQGQEAARELLKKL